jgi:Galactose oxidase, central domain
MRTPATTLSGRLHAAFSVVAVSGLVLTSTGAMTARGAQRVPRPARPAMSLAVAGASWTKLPAAPIPPRSEYAAVWTGTKMIVWGGYSGPGQYGDGATYDPATRTWAKMAASPLAAREGAVSVWTGKDMLIFGGEANSGSFSDGAGYDPATNTWRKLAPIPSSLGGQLADSGSYAVWTGKVMLVWGFFGNGGGAHGGSLAAATYNPATNSWATGAVAPAQAPLFGDAFWTGKEMIVWGSSLATGASSGHLEGPEPPSSRWKTEFLVAARSASTSPPGTGPSGRRRQCRRGWKPTNSGRGHRCLSGAAGFPAAAAASRSSRDTATRPSPSARRLPSRSSSRPAIARTVREPRTVRAIALAHSWAS